MCVLCHLISQKRYSSWHLPWCGQSLLQFIRSCPSGQGQFLCQWPLPTLMIVACYSEWHVECLSSPANLFSAFHLSDSDLCQHQRLYQLQQRASSFAPPSSWFGLLLQIPYPLIGLLFLGFCVTFVPEWFLVQLSVQGSCWHTELQAVALMLHKLAFQLSDKMVALQLDNHTKKVHLHHQVVHYLFFFPDLPTTYWIWLTNMVLLLFWHTFLPISMWKLTIFCGESWSQSSIFFLT